MPGKPRAVFLPPLVQDLVCYDNTTTPPNPGPNLQGSEPLKFLGNQGCLSADTIQSCIPDSVVTTQAATHGNTRTSPSTTTSSTVTVSATDPCDLAPFKAACIAVQLELLELSTKSSKSLKDIYADTIGWLGVAGKRAAEIWFELYERQAFDQALIVGSTVLEQLISNIIYTLQGPDKFIPFLVRDLLAVRCLTKCIDKSLIHVLKTMIGSPLTLNIRNLLWHGFILPGDDIPLDAYGAMLIAVTMTITHNARTILSPTLLAIRHQHPKAFYIGQGQAQGAVTEGGNEDEFDALYEKVAFGTTPPFLDSSNLIVILNKIILQSQLVTPGTAQQWTDACRYLESDGEGKNTSGFVFVMTTLPLLEHALRLLYVSVNQCKEDRKSALIAGEYYLTLDVILDKDVPAEYYDTDSPMLAKAIGSCDPSPIPNQLHSVLGEKVMNLLDDLFIHGSGPRIRDRTSHGELNSYLMVDITREPWFHYYTGLVIHLLYKYLPSNSTGSQFPEVLKYTSWIEEYATSRFDEWNVLKRETCRCQALLLEHMTATAASADVVDPGESSNQQPIDVILAYDNAVVFSSPWDVTEVSLESQLGFSLSSWQAVKQNDDPLSLPKVLATSNLSAWILILQSIHGAIQKVTVKVKVLTEQLLQRQLSSRSRKQFEAMRPIIPRLLGMLKGCLALVELFVLNPSLAECYFF
ncbi:hypothetical protein B0O80DRAFT_464453 [Mortierella sp. GBAus27b]|nr:hypothetical protein B0O80DRAFT_464453 [Mortierella sp. GBAus27b]